MRTRMCLRESSLFWRPKNRKAWKRCLTDEGVGSVRFGFLEVEDHVRAIQNNSDL
jgi:hypothetical protein